MLTDPISRGASVQAASDLVSRKLADEAIVLQLRTGVYYSLNSVGARIWDLLQRPTTLAELRDRLVEEYVVDADSCRGDLTRLLNSLAVAGLVHVDDNSLA